MMELADLERYVLLLYPHFQLLSPYNVLLRPRNVIFPKSSVSIWTVEIVEDVDEEKGGRRRGNLLCYLAILYYSLQLVDDCG
jgi:hypothetical protein